MFLFFVLLLSAYIHLRKKRRLENHDNFWATSSTPALKTKSSAFITGA